MHVRAVRAVGLQYRRYPRWRGGRCLDPVGERGLRAADERDGRHARRRLRRGRLRSARSVVSGQLGGGQCADRGLSTPHPEGGLGPSAGRGGPAGPLPEGGGVVRGRVDRLSDGAVDHHPRGPGHRPGRRARTGRPDRRGVGRGGGDLGVSGPAAHRRADLGARSRGGAPHADPAAWAGGADLLRRRPRHRGVGGQHGRHPRSGPGRTAGRDGHDGVPG